MRPKGFKRVYHPYTAWEEYHAGMWVVTTGPKRDAYVKASADLMRDADQFEAAMIRAVNEWPNSCEVAMTTPSLNHQAWMGHAGCCIATGSPEDCTRLGWHTLTQDQQDAANAAADRAIVLWGEQYAKTRTR